MVKLVNQLPGRDANKNVSQDPYRVKAKWPFHGLHMDRRLAKTYIHWDDLMGI